uniref:RUN domain-containing protein n=1 Tax=Ascaris lumbricoides TaxID=6252 RepID=A0A0M3I011_ASCLU
MFEASSMDWKLLCERNGVKSRQAGAIEEIQHILTLRRPRELGDSERVLSESEFDTIVSEAIRRVLGHAAPTYTLGPYDGNSRKGSIVVSASDSHLVWAALSIYGRHFGAPIALHLNSVDIH